MNLFCLFKRHSFIKEGNFYICTKFIYNSFLDYLKVKEWGRKNPTDLQQSTNVPWKE